MLSLEGGGGLAMGGLAMGVWLWGGGGFHREGRGVPQGGGGRGHFGPAAIYCTTTWCFALKGLRTTRGDPAPVAVRGADLPCAKQLSRTLWV